ncbi:sterigmatocystin biosynthesis P450 monooxygenase StcS [Sporormia fimetaria CBS 119925]|uniref:Sterigmatocystin biosynthesis P450 monooxygenase StcS n=1 Tax=Sporormia fimetaria CBS 119925 TaxID=1340428 RepID=A0A6A6UYZ3_9PLEO|nr:sterigmatocystin biosynthesis P450 monooxygenase StcS [Sporormia fimetaria CBS 119925]
MGASTEWLPLLTPTFLLILLTVLSTTLLKLYAARKEFVDLKNRGLPVAPNHSLLFGHLLYLKSYLDRLPPDAHYQYAVGDIAADHFSSTTGAFYLDLWPMTGITLIITSANAATQITQTISKIALNRPPLLTRFFEPITGGPNMFDMPEQAWRPWRVAFNAAFKAERLWALVPGMVEEVEIYSGLLRERATEGEMMFLEPMTLRFTIDMIGKMILNSSLGSQTGYNDLADGMLSQIQWWHNANGTVNPFKKLNLMQRYMYWKNSRQMDHYIGSVLDDKYIEYKKNPEIQGLSVIDLVLKAYLQGPFKKHSSLPENLDPEFRAMAIRQVRLFVFTGHDSTASTLCYIFLMLSRHPEVLTRLRKEHDEVLGDVAGTASRLASDPRLVGNLPYTLAVIKETMRLNPVAGSSRAGAMGLDVTDDEGNLCPTHETMVLWVVHPELHRNGKYWVRSDEFLPERFMVPEGHELYPEPGAWRPFEVGPRNCVAQALVLIELRVMLACLVRSFNISPAYEEWHVKKRTKGRPNVHGEIAYMTEKGAAHPVCGFPCRISLAEAVARGKEGDE